MAADLRQARVRSEAVLSDADRAIRDARAAQRALHARWRRLYDDRAGDREPE